MYKKEAVKKSLPDCHPKLVEGSQPINNKMFRQAQHDSQIIKGVFRQASFIILYYSITRFTTSITVPSTHFMAAIISSPSLGLAGFPQIFSASSFSS